MDNVLLHIPHSSRVIPQPWRGQFLVSDEVLARELLVMTDAFTDELFELPGQVEKLIFPVSRLLVDPERFREDFDEPMAARGMGAVYTKTHNGQRLKGSDRREALIQEFYDPHHEALGNWTTSAIERSGSCLILDCHSFPSEALPCDLDQSPDRPDICIGSDVFHTSAALIEKAVSLFTDCGWMVRIDTPYAGTMVPLEFLGKDRGVASLMIEVSRKLYMNEVTGDKGPRFDDVKLKLDQALSSLIGYWKTIAQWSPEAHD